MSPEVPRVPYRRNLRMNTPRQIIIKLTKIKDKEEILKATNSIKGSPIRLSADCSPETEGQKGVA